LSVYGFRGKQCSESLPLLAGITENPYFSHLLCTVDEIHYKINVCNAVQHFNEFYEHCHGDGCTFLVGINEITFTFVL